jgi:hypothetical protein
MLQPIYRNNHIYQLAPDATKNVATICAKLVKNNLGQTKTKYKHGKKYSDNNLYIIFGDVYDKSSRYNITKIHNKTQKPPKTPTNKKSDIGFYVRFNFDHKRDNHNSSKHISI